MSIHTCLGFFTLLFTAPFALLAAGESDACPDGSCGSASGTVLLAINSSSKKVKWEGLEAEGESSTGVLGAHLALPETVRSYRTEAERMTAMANLEYDSDGDDSSASRELIDLEFRDEYDSEEDQNTELFHQYVESQGYYEGGDATFTPDVWNNAPEIKASHNCYMYALNDISPRSGVNCRETQIMAKDGQLDVEKKEMHKICKRYFHKPGYYFQNVASGRAKTDVWFREETSCKLMLPMIAADSPAIVWNNKHNTSLSETDSCPDRHYMAALFIHPKAGFHFYRRDHKCADTPNEWCWSHKPGILKATDVDASGEKIRRVLQANRNYGELNYSDHCAFFCVPQNAVARTHSDSRKTGAHH